MTVHHAPALACEQRPSRRRNCGRFCLVAAAALGMCSPAMAFAPPHIHSRVAGASQFAACCRVTTTPLRLQMAGEASKASWVSAIGSKLRNKVRTAFSEMRGDTIDQSMNEWKIQSNVVREAEEEAENMRKIARQGNDYATQMMGMQSMMTKKNLITYQHEVLGQHPTSFLSLYSEMVADSDGKGSLPFVPSNQLGETSAAVTEDGEVRHESLQHLTPLCRPVLA